MKDFKTPFIIFSINQEGESESDNRNTHSAYALTFPTIGLPFKSLLGCYKGTCEESFLVADNSKNRAFVLGIARRHNQQSILIVDADRYAELLYLNLNTSQPIGKFVAVSKSHALQQDNWTFDPETENFYTTT